MNKPIFKSFPILKTERLILRRLDIPDKKELYVLRSDHKNMTYIDRKIPKNTDEVLEFIKKINDGIDNNELIYWAITLKRYK